ncbi:MAG: stage III sporulation protein AB [Oscillospiraceae bacterium]|jgi:stage III sporulation protein AB|nr:stage III sporulation protein AB [Oscillospiraceae bacterium]
MRWIALGLIFSACGLAGALLSRALQVRVRELEALLRLLSTLRTQMQFSRAPLEPMLSQACGQGQTPAFLPVCIAAMRAGAAFPAAWRESAAHGFGLRPEDRQLLLSLGELLGATDAEGQREGLLLHEELCRDLLEDARKRKESRGRSFFTLGILSGLTVVILFM